MNRSRGYFAYSPSVAHPLLQARLRRRCKRIGADCPILGRATPQGRRRDPRCPRRSRRRAATGVRWRWEVGGHARRNGWLLRGAGPRRRNEPSPLLPVDPSRRGLGRFLDRLPGRAVQATRRTGKPAGLQKNQDVPRRVREAPRGPQLARLSSNGSAVSSSSNAPARATTVDKVGLGVSAENSRRITSGRRSARRASSALLSFKLHRRWSSARMMASIWSMFRRAAVYARS